MEDSNTVPLRRRKVLVELETDSTNSEAAELECVDGMGQEFLAEYKKDVRLKYMCACRNESV